MPTHQDEPDCGHPGAERHPCPFGGRCACCESCSELCAAKLTKPCPKCQKEMETQDGCLVCWNCGYTASLPPMVAAIEKIRRKVASGVPPSGTPRSASPCPQGGQHEWEHISLCHDQCRKCRAVVAPIDDAPSLEEVRAENARLREQVAMLLENEKALHEELGKLALENLTGRGLEETG